MDRRHMDGWTGEFLCDYFITLVRNTDLALTLTRRRFSKGRFDEEWRYSLGVLKLIVLGLWGAAFCLDRDGGGRVEVLRILRAKGLVSSRGFITLCDRDDRARSPNSKEGEF